MSYEFYFFRSFSIIRTNVADVLRTASSQIYLNTVEARLLNQISAKTVRDVNKDQLLLTADFPVVK